MKELHSSSHADVYYDLAEDGLIIGGAALDDAIEAGQHPADIQVLRRLLHQPERPVDSDFTPPTDYSQWDPALDVPTAKWLHALIQESHPEEKSALSEEALVRAGYLGLIPRITYFKKRPGGTQGLYAEAELRDVKMRGYFDSWTAQDYVNYVRKLGETLKRKPQHEDFVEYARIAGNPSEKQMQKQFGKPSVALELAGWVNVKEWDTNDFIDWGVHFMFVNDGLVPTSRHLRYVCAGSRGIGPGPDAIYDHEDFSSLMDFQTKVAEEYTKQHLSRESTEKLLIEQTEIDAQHNPIVQELLDGLDEPVRRAQTYAKFLLIYPLLPEDIVQSELKAMCQMKQASYFVERVIRVCPEVSLAELETMAAAKGLTDIIWPPDYTKDPLRVANWPEDWAA